MYSCNSLKCTLVLKSLTKSTWSYSILKSLKLLDIESQYYKSRHFDLASKLGNSKDSWIILARLNPISYLQKTGNTRHDDFAQDLRKTHEEEINKFEKDTWRKT